MSRYPASSASGRPPYDATIAHEIGWVLGLTQYKIKGTRFDQVYGNNLQREHFDNNATLDKLILVPDQLILIHQSQWVKPIKPSEIPIKDWDK